MNFKCRNSIAIFCTKLRAGSLLANREGREEGIRDPKSKADRIPVLLRRTSIRLSLGTDSKGTFQRGLGTAEIFDTFSR